MTPPESQKVEHRETARKKLHVHHRRNGEYRYRMVEDWAKLPEGWSFKGSVCARRTHRIS